MNAGEIIRTIATLTASFASIFISAAALALSIVVITPSYSTALICEEASGYYRLEISQESGQSRTPHVYLEYDGRSIGDDESQRQSIRWHSDNAENPNIHVVKVPVVFEGNATHGATIRIIPYERDPYKRDWLRVLREILNYNAIHRDLNCFDVVLTRE